MKIEFDLTYEEYLNFLKEERKTNEIVKQLEEMGLAGIAEDLFENWTGANSALDFLSQKDERLNDLQEYDEYWNDITDLDKDIESVAKRCWNFIN